MYFDMIWETNHNKRTKQVYLHSGMLPKIVGYEGQKSSSKLLSQIHNGKQCHHFTFSGNIACHFCNPFVSTPSRSCHAIMNC